MSEISANLQQIKLRIDEAARKAARQSSDIQLLAVSKTKPVCAIEQAIACGQRAFGENYLQEAVDKITTLKDHTDLEWHFIGPIQSNKTRPLAEHFQWVHGVDREKVARRLNEQRPAELPPLNICLQVNIDNEESKSGVSPEELPALVTAISQYPQLKLRGLMCIPKARDNQTEQQQAFTRLYALREMLNENLQLNMDTLSMGMSSDLEAAIAAGSTMVRIGTDIFGAR